MDAKGETAANRYALAEVFDGIAAAQWAEPSLCEGWSNQHVLAHLTMPFRLSMPAFLTAMALARGRFEVASDRVAHRDAAIDSAVLIASIRAAAARDTKFPGGGYEGALTHDVVHGLDICRPLGIRPPITDDALHLVLQILADPKRTAYFNADVSGKRLQATDLDWSYGEGELIAEPAHDLVLRLSGRTGRTVKTGRPPQ